jgi:hypothetical protein
MSLIAELKRRKVFKLGAAYLVVAWLAVQAASIAFPAFEAPPGRCACSSSWRCWASRWRCSLPG